MMVKEKDLLNMKVYRIKKQDYFVSRTMKEKLNRNIKHRSKESKKKNLTFVNKRQSRCARTCWRAKFI